MLAHISANVDIICGMRILIFAIAGSLFGQNAPHIRNWKPDPSETELKPKTSCGALHSLTGYDLSVIVAEAMPGFCRVLIQVQPEIRIEVSLPAKWNRRLYMFGNGGYAGENLDAPARVTHRNTALSSGFVVTQTNTGHDAAREPLATFTLNSQKFLDYAFRSLHVTAETAKRVAETYYGSRPARSYYNGCSTGGRQGLILAQRYPDDFDGIIAGAPALNNVQNRLRSIATYQAVAKAPLPVSKLKLLSDRIYERCDTSDGLKDALIADPRRCDFRAGRDLPVCAGADGPDCFTAAQIGTLETIYGDIVLNGKPVARGWPVGAEIAGPTGISGWNGWILREQGMGQGAQYAESAVRYMIFDKPDPTYELAQFNLEKDAQKFEATGRIMNATDTDLTRFRQRGGKLFMYFGVGRSCSQSAHRRAVLRRRAGAYGRLDYRFLPALHDAGRVPLQRRRRTRELRHTCAADTVGGARPGASAHRGRASGKRRGKRQGAAYPAALPVSGNRAISRAGRHQR
jgi:feruloyl esterase